MNHLSKLPKVETTIFTVMSRLAHQHKAINLSQGFPDFPTDPKLIELVTKAMKAGYNQYAPMPGIYSLREVIAEKIESLHKKTYDPEHEITITAGATQAIFTIISTFIRPGDEVLLFKPAYDCYEPAIVVNGGIPVFVQLQGKEFKVDWSEVKNKISSKTKMVIINTPHNPSGTVLSKEDMLRLEAVLADTDIILLSDEVYEHIVFDGKAHQSASRFPGLAERTFICASFGKTFHNTGWKTGYCVAPKQLMEEFRKTHQFNVFCANHPMQRAFATYLEDASSYLELPAFYERKRDAFLEMISGSKFSFTPSKGTYFQLLDYSAITDESDVDFAKRLCTEYGLASIPISVFNVNNEDNRLLRFCFAKKEETLQKAARILNTTQ
ncbi:methionine aminotransferase [Sungkyunkwania multivorans]|uniref:Methionine aminotransferase n=1 Tax=Sungkyunkwania multivorans TaxID=1173618 RepID=A0ABW3D1E7_9FLAO